MNRKNISKIKRFFDAKGINILFISSKEEKYKRKVCETIKEVYKKWNKKIGTSELNRWFSSIWETVVIKKFLGL